MSAENPNPGLERISDESARVAGVLVGSGISVKGADGSVGSGAESLAAAIWFAYLNEAATMFEQDYASREDIDAAMRFGCGYPVGPLAQLDAIGLDKAVAVLQALAELSGDSRHRPAAILKSLAAAGKTGQRAGEGIYSYVRAGSGEPADSSASTEPTTSTSRPISKVGVIGTGTMATGIIEVFAKSGFDVTYVARSDEKVALVRAALQKSLGKQVAKGRLSEEDRDAVLARVGGTTEHADLGDVDIVVEAIVEDLSTKLALFESLDAACKPGAILATTTSSLSIRELAAATSRPADVIGMHFFNPAPIMKLVEVVSTDQTAADVTDTVVELCKQTKKHPVLCGDRAGFIVNFLLFPYLNDAVRAVEASLISIEDLDGLMKAWQNLPLGPFSLLDVVGNDVSLAIEETIYTAFPDVCYAPAELLQKIVANGKLGRKSGEGFLAYS